MGYFVYTLLSIGSVAASVVAAVYLQPLFVMRFVEWLFPRVLWRVPVKRGAGGKKVIALTIDDAPRHGAREILDLLKEHGCKATWFIIESYGQSAPQPPSLRPPATRPLLLMPLLWAAQGLGLALAHVSFRKLADALQREETQSCECCVRAMKWVTTWWRTGPPFV